MDKQSILDVFETLRDKREYTLPPVDNAREFWGDVAREFYYYYPVKNESGKVTWIKCNSDSFSQVLYRALDLGDMMGNFRDGESLDLVTRDGKILKRLNRYVKKISGYEIDSAMMGKVGDRMQSYVTKQASSVVFDMHDNIDWEDGMYGHSGSCWWDVYEESRPTFDNAGGWSMRFYRDMNDRQGIGRTWLLPWNDAIVGFNSYGVSRETVVKILTAQFKDAGIELKFADAKVKNENSKDIPYINGGTGFVLALDGHDLLEQAHNDDTIYLDIQVIRDMDGYESNRGYTCDDCGGRVHEDETYNDPHGNIICEDCYNRNYSYCEKCDNTCSNDDMVQIQDHDRYSYVCDDCARELDAVQCYDCEKYFTDDYTIMDDSGDAYCSDCMPGDAFHCDDCGNHYELNQGCESCQTGCFAQADPDESTNTNGESTDDSPLLSVQSETVTLHTRIDGIVKPREHTVKVTRIRNMPGLFIYNIHDIGTGEKGYCVIHESSGLATVGTIDRMSTAIDYMMRIYPIVPDWNSLDAQNIPSNVSDSIMAIRQAMSL
jgi:hypothetical protein